MRTWLLNLKFLSFKNCGQWNSRFSTNFLQSFQESSKKKFFLKKLKMKLICANTIHSKSFDKFDNNFHYNNDIHRAEINFSLINAFQLDKTSFSYLWFEYHVAVGKFVLTARIVVLNDVNFGVVLGGCFWKLRLKIFPNNLFFLLTWTIMSIAISKDLRSFRIFTIFRLSQDFLIFVDFHASNYPFLETLSAWFWALK